MSSIDHKGKHMLDSFRRRDPPRPPAARPASPYAELRGALNPTTPAGPEAKQEPSKVDVQRSPVQTDASSADGNVVCKLIVGPEIKLKGVEITDCDTLVVQGRVEASMNSRVIQIAECGVFVGKVGIDNAEIRGRFDGELTVRNQLVIRSTGRVSGKIRYGKISVDEGGELSGDVAAIAATPGSSLDVHGLKRKSVAATEAPSTFQTLAGRLTGGENSSGTGPAAATRNA
jgi:cytoskeletal protein CcmA (bactofilin family)